MLGNSENDISGLKMLVRVDLYNFTGTVKLIYLNCYDLSTDLVKVLTASLLICPVHTVPVPITDIVGINAAVVRALKLSRMARTTQIYHTHTHQFIYYISCHT